MEEDHDSHSHAIENSEGMDCEHSYANASESSEEVTLLRGQMHKLKELLKESQQQMHQAQKETLLLRQQLAESEEALLHREAAVKRAYEDQLNVLKRQVAETQVENGRYKQRMEKLSQVVLERERKIVELQQYENNFRKIGEQKLALNAVGEKQMEQMRILQCQNEQIYKELEESQQHAQQLERVIRFLRERQEEAQLETNQFRDEFQKAQIAIADQKEIAKIAEQKKQELEAALQQESTARQEALEEVKVLYSQFEMLKKMLAESKDQISLTSSQQQEAERVVSNLNETKFQLEFILKQKDEKLEVLEKEITDIKQSLIEGIREAKEMETRYHEAIKDKSSSEEYISHYKRDLEEAEKRYQQVLNEKQLLNDNLHSAKSALEEAEARLKMAQQHLAKKVKETSDLNDRLHSQELVLQDLQNNLNQTRSRTIEQQQTIEAQFQQEKRLQDQLIEASRSTETIVTKWEEKYFKVYEKWQENEIRLRDLKKLEEKYNQMQALLSNIGGLFGSPLNYSNPPNSVHQPFDERSLPPSFLQEEGLRFEETTCQDNPSDNSFQHEISPVMDEKSDTKGPYQNLFDMPKQLKRPKYNLFE